MHVALCSFGQHFALLVNIESLVESPCLSSTCDINMIYLMNIRNTFGGYRNESEFRLKSKLNLNAKTF